MSAMGDGGGDVDAEVSNIGFVGGIATPPFDPPPGGTTAAGSVVAVDEPGIVEVVVVDEVVPGSVVLNLVSNAARHGGDEIAVESVMRGGVVSIRVIDDGPGVSADIEPYLFNRYLHGDGRAPLSGSVGLGTAVAAAYAESFGGTIEYLRASDRTVFEVRLPAVIIETEPALT